jgi:transcriptional antiterminator RfaH
MKMPFCPESGPLSCDPGQWDEASLPVMDELTEPLWVIHTKARNEKALARDLFGKGIRFFLPMIRVTRRYAGRHVSLRIPLFPSYLFLSGSEEDRYTVLMTHRAACVIRVADQERLRGELQQIHLVTSSETEVDLYPGIRKGRRCRVTGGPLVGLEGVVLRRRDICRVYVGVEVLGQSADLEVDASLLEVID